MTPKLHIYHRPLLATTSQLSLSSLHLDLSAEARLESVTSMIHRILGGRTALDLVHNP